MTKRNLKKIVPPPLAGDVITKMSFRRTVPGVLDSVYYDFFSKQLATRRCLQMFVRNRKNLTRGTKYEVRSSKIQFGLPLKDDSYPVLHTMDGRIWSHDWCDIREELCPTDRPTRPFHARREGRRRTKITNNKSRRQCLQQKGQDDEPIEEHKTFYAPMPTYKRSEKDESRCR